MLRFYAAFAFLSFFCDVQTYACGFNFVGDCSTYISLKINGTQDSFAVAPCPGVLNFDGFALGNLQTLSIARAKATTWESCQNNVSGMSLFYRVFEQGFPGGTWQSIDLQEDYNTLVGPYTTRYRSVNTNNNLTNGLTVGKTYVLEIYFRADVDTIGDDFVPETTLLQNNNGQNYHFTFQYGGVSAPPFVVATTKVIDVKCHGDSTGVAGVSVYGNQNGLFYQWSTGGNNFWILSEVPAGTYAVTVTGAGGYSAGDTIEITQPMPLAAEFAVTGIECNGVPGAAAAMPSGGTAPYFYYWENGAQDSVASFPESGNQGLTVTDVTGCSAGFFVNIPAQPVDTVSLVAAICEGEMYTFGETDFPAPGFYEIFMPGAGGACDTLVQLNLDVRAAPFITLDLETVAPFACSESDPVHVVIETTTDADEPTYEWVFNGEVISTADTCPFVFQGAGLLPVVTVTDKYGCSAQSGGYNVSISQPFPLLVLADVVNPVGGFDNGAIALAPNGGTPPYTVLWSNNVTTWEINNLGPGTYCATVTDARGCTVTICETLESSGVTDLSNETALKIAPNPVGPGQQVEITLPEYFTGQEVHLEILDGRGITLSQTTTVPNQKSILLSLPENLPAGTFVIHLTGKDGKSATGRITVH